MDGHGGWKEAQHRSFAAWVNRKLDKAGSGRQVEDLTKDLRDGVVLLAVLGQLYPELMPPRHHAEPKSEVHRLDNLAVALKVLEAQGVRLESVTARMLLEGSEVAVMGLVWTLIKEVELRRMTRQMGGPSAAAKDPLLEWVRGKCAPRGVKVDNWTSSWTDGRALLAVVAALRPDLVDFAAVGPDTSGRRNIERALDTGEDEMDVAALVAVNDVLAPDERAIMTHVAQYLQYELTHGKVLASLSRLAEAQHDQARPGPGEAAAAAALAAGRLEQERRAQELAAAQAALAAQRAALEQQRAALSQAQAQQQAALAQQRSQYEALQRQQQELEVRRRAMEEQQRSQQAQQQAYLQQQQLQQQQAAQQQAYLQQQAQQQAYLQQQAQQQAYLQQQTYLQQQQLQRMMAPPAPPPALYGSGGGGGGGTINVSIRDTSQAGTGGAVLLQPPPAQDQYKEIVCKKCKQVTRYTTAQAQQRVRCKGCSAVLIKKGLFRQ